MKIFVTGATGFLGRRFCQTATVEGHELLCLTRTPEPRLPAACLTVEGTLAAVPWDEVDRFAPGAVLHLAWVATPGVYLTSPENETLATQSEALFQQFAERGVPHLVGIGTCIEYAPSDEPLDEGRSALAPAFAYSRAKVSTSQRLQAIAAQHGVTSTWGRVFYPYGEGEHRDRMPSALMRKVAAGETLELKTPDSVKDYIHVQDAAAALLAIIEKRLPGAVNIGTGQGVRILDLARDIARVCGGREGQVRRSPTPAEDPFPITVANVSKLRSTGWLPRVGLAEGLERLHVSLGLHS
ncbi:hypothetical protein AYO49_03020 [Verrucomicrobiaceae bacterium SCGC AG-212-N21]|nr:hypothetical protein AYO49_03020 [Verrucomicrobiaceae bacterium SCGC AG-212-N21]